LTKYIKLENRGRYNTCRKCGYQFKITNKEKRVEWDKKKSKCPMCKESYCLKPETERKLMVLQDKYFYHNRDMFYLDQMSEILINYSQSLIKKFYSPYIVNEGDLESYSYCSVSFLVEEYYNHEDYKVYASFAGALIDKIKQALFNKYNKLQEDLSLNWDFDDSHSDSNFYHIDKYSSKEYEIIEENENKKYLVKYIINILFGISDFCKTEKEDVVRLLAFHHNILYGERFAEKLFQEDKYDGNGKLVQYKIYGRKYKEVYLKTLDIIRKELLKLDEINR